MGTQIFLTICLGALGFMVYCLVYFVQEGRTPRSQLRTQNPRIIPFPKHRSVHGQPEEVRRRA